MLRPYKSQPNPVGFLVRTPRDVSSAAPKNGKKKRRAVLSLTLSPKTALQSREPMSGQAADFRFDRCGCRAAKGVRQSALGILPPGQE